MDVFGVTVGDGFVVVVLLLVVLGVLVCVSGWVSLCQQVIVSVLVCLVCCVCLEEVVVLVQAFVCVYVLCVRYVSAI